MSATVITTVCGEFAPVFGTALAMRTLVEYLIYLGAIMIVTVIVTLWIASTRQPLQHSDHRDRRHRSSRSWFGTWFGKGDEDGSTGKKRRRRRSHRKRNPTLAETGGLPPIRSDTSSSAERSQP